MNNNEILIKSKLRPFETGLDTIKRERIIKRLRDNQGKKLISFIAPTGYGKTVMATQYADLIESPVCWYQLDEYDNDLTLFIRYMVCCIEEKWPHFGKQILKLIEKSENIVSIMHTVVALFVNELDVRADRGLLFVFDDYQFITAMQIHKFIELLLTYLPEKVQFIILSRMSLPINITRLKLYGHIIELTMEELKFDEYDVELLFKNRDVPREILNQYLEKTDGWAVALSLLQKVSLNTDDPSTLLCEYSQEEIYHYFTEEVFAQLSEEIQVFLMKTSILGVMTVGVCNAVTERNDSKDILEYILRQNLFITKIKEKDTVYRYHCLFRDYLEQYLGNEKQELCQKAANYYQDSGYSEQAIEFYLRSRRFQEAIHVIEKIAIGMIKSGRWQMAERWMPLFSANDIKGSAYIMLLLGVAHSYNSHWKQAHLLFDRSIEVLSIDGLCKDLVEVQFQKALTYRRSGKLEKSMVLLNIVIEKAIHEPIIKWYSMILEKVNTLLWMGRLKEAVAVLEKGIERAEDDLEIAVISYFKAYLGATYYTMGDYYKAIEYYQSSRDLYNDVELSEYEREQYSQRTVLASIYREWGELDQAYSLIEEEIAVKEHLGIVDDLPRAYHQLALICFDLKDYEVAFQYFKKSHELYERLDRKDFQWTWHMAVYGNILYGVGRKIQGEEMVKRAIQYSKNKGVFNQAFCEYIGSNIHLAKGEINEAFKKLKNALYVATEVNAKNLMCQCHWSLANIYEYMKKNDKLQEHTAVCFQLAHEGNYLQVFLSYPKGSLPIIKCGIEMGVEESFVNLIVVRLGKKAFEVLYPLLNHKDQKVQKRASYLISMIQKETTISEYKIIIKNFGEFQVIESKNGQPIQWKTTKAMELFAYFVRHAGEHLYREKILETLWPEMDPMQTSKWLYTYIYQIRSVLKKVGIEECLIYKDKGYYFNSQDIQSDLVLFDKRIERIKNDENPKDIHIQEIQDIYTGPYLDGWYSDWVLNERRFYEETYSLYVKKWVISLIEINNNQKALDALCKLLTVDHFSMFAYEQLIRIYEKMGDQHNVLRIYAQYCTVLEELLISPSEEIVAIYQRVQY